MSVSRVTVMVVDGGVVQLNHQLGRLLNKIELVNTKEEKERDFVIMGPLFGVQAWC